MADERLVSDRFPRASGYHPEWVLAGVGGAANPLWLTEWLAEALDLRPGMRVLDLGCGRAMSSVFLRREFGVQVWATDLWFSASENLQRIQDAGVEDGVFPIHADARSLPFAEGFFDAVVSIDTYQYFGTDELYLGYLARFLRPGGRIGIVVPGLVQELGPDVPAHLVAPQANGKVFWEDECRSFKTAQWWGALWGRSSRVRDVHAELLPDGWRHWRDFERALELAGKSVFPSDAEAIERDAGRWLGFVRVVATRSETGGMNLYDPALGALAGVDR